MNIYDIAERAGVSIATVSRVLNGSPNVSTKTKAKVLGVIEEAGYTPNVFARGLGLNTMKMIGVLCTDVADIFYAKAVSVIENALRQYGYDSLLCSTGKNLEDKQKYIDLLLAKRVDALILIGSIFKEETDNSHIEKAAAKVPTVIINGLIDVPNTYCVTCDEYQAMYDQVIHLNKKGCHDILYLYDVESYSGLQKLNGFKDALKHCGFGVNPKLIAKVDKDMSQIEATVIELLDADIHFSAIIASEDQLAIGAMHALQKKGFHIPEDIPVIGFNNSLLCECAMPKLSSVDNMVETLCNTAVNVLTDVFDGKTVTNKMTLSAKLVERDTFKL
ncbi:LacI family DNA-binding transcriptional regulator [Cellulosilyticum sp. ST5]|uniref:LacI family DNA-binding transcriptional regulator n=1 Tax=Cellulosilyticum sp. ST5 TaxID=3055805 RepID=UPI0039775C32